MVFFTCLFSAALLVLSFPRTEWTLLAWMALVPVLIMIDGTKPWRAFRRAWLFGFLFFGLALGWLIYVTYIGAFLLAAFLALYVGIFGALFVYFQRFALLPRIFLLSCVWVVLEYVRGHFLSGMGWAMLGHTQYRNLWLIQAADITGVYGISFLVVLVNLLIFETWRARRFLRKASSIVTVIIAVALGYGWWTVAHSRYDQTIKVGLVQPDIPLADTWNDSLFPKIIDETIQTTQALKWQKLDLIVWPETALPGVITDSPLLAYEIRSTAAGFHTPMLIGSIAQDGTRYYNSAFYIGADGQMLGRYDKIHLVPFGEYLPVRPLLGWIDKYVPISDFSWGTAYKVFSLGPSGPKFSALVCFEDTLEELDRHFADGGAAFFVNITNDAWFKQTREPFMHLQIAVFGCVANHRSLARAANTGITAVIDPVGRITAILADGRGQKLFVKGTAVGLLPVNNQKTLYTKYGDIFTMACFLCILLAVAPLKMRKLYLFADRSEYA